MVNTNKNREVRREICRYSEALKQQVVSEIDSGSLTIKEAMEFYDIGWRRTLNRWCHKYGKDKINTRIVRVIMKNEQERIHELEKALADKELELLATRSLVLVYEEGYGKDIKKKLSSKQLAKLENLRRKAKLQ